MNDQYSGNIGNHDHLTKDGDGQYAVTVLLPA